jgi:hypothetical protein
MHAHRILPLGRDMIPRLVGQEAAELRSVKLGRVVCFYFGFYFGASLLVCFARSPNQQSTFCFYVIVFVFV